VAIHAFDQTSMTRRFREYFPQRAVRMLRDRPVPFGDGFVDLLDSRLTLLTTDREPALRVPTDAIVLPDRTGAAKYIVYSGDRAPEPYR
jgi:hypothetical protein